MDDVEDHRDLDLRPRCREVDLFELRLVAVDQDNPGEPALGVVALTCASVARCERNASIAGGPSSRGWRRPWNTMKRLIHPRYASSVRGL